MTDLHVHDIVIDVTGEPFLIVNDGENVEPHLLAQPIIDVWTDECEIDSIAGPLRRIFHCGEERDDILN
jgi:hypothetical protein